MSDWIRVSRQNPCGQCGRPDWCAISSDGEAILCMRTQSDNPIAFKSGEIGWLHKTGNKSNYVSAHRKSQPERVIKAQAIMGALSRQTTAEHIRQLSDDLGVKASALVEMGVAWSDSHNAYAFPMYDGFGRAVGIRLRNKEGDKWAISGSKSGLFYSCNGQLDGEYRMVVTEGPTCCAAALSMNMFGVGRASCSSGIFEILDLIRRLKIREAILIADNDEDKVRPDGSKYNPGLDGCESLSARLTIPHCCITLPYKDLRSAYKDGFSYDMLDSIVNEAVWRKTTKFASA